MKKFNTILQLLLSVLLVFTLTQTVSAQEAKVPFNGYVYLQPNVGIHQYFGDLNENDFYDKEINLAYGAALGWQFSRVVGIRGHFNMGKVSGGRDDLGAPSCDFSSKLMYGGGQLTLNVNELFNNNPKRLLNLYLMGGAGYLNSKSTQYQLGTENPLPNKENISKSSFMVPAGLGLGIRLSEVVGLNLEYNHNILFNDDVVDNFKNVNNKEINDHFGFASLGLQIRFKSSDRDGDGVPDKKDLCPDEYGTVELMGCPDKDGDGIADKDDECPNEPGLAEFNGCPDTDGDGIPDHKDECPNEAGSKELNGCPDKDGDGIPDHKDECPNEFGLAEFNGCPDTDGDGIPDKDDECPDLRGPKSTRGCPDTDGDGIPDKDDDCPTVPGTAANRGCPETPKGPSVEIFKVVYFNTASSVVISKYTKDLNEVADLMKQHSDVKVSVAGHADSRGDEGYNMRLSEKRADYVINYLAKKGIEKERIIKSFHGITQPAAPNDGPTNWAKNRRVEIKSVL
ncbi:MAG: OmpA family protein [Lentimicrobiaceae bacterium]|nr:OmpA family protein [Lentimicrobiaceae bacterium]